MIATSKPFSQSTNSLADQATQGTDSAIASTQRVANQALSSLSEKVHDARDQAAPVINRVASKAEELARRGAEVMRERTDYVKDRAYRASDATVGYIKDEPLKSILIAAVAGAAVMALITLLSRDR